MGNAISKAFFGRPITITGIIAIISYLVYYRRKKRLLLEKKKKEEAEKQNNSDGFDGKGQIVVETLSKRKSFDDQVKHAKEKDGRLLTVEEAKAFIKHMDGLDCDPANFFAVYPEKLGEGKEWIVGKGSKKFKCESGQTHVEAYKSDAKWGDKEWTHPYGFKLGPGTDLVVYRLPKGVNRAAPKKIIPSKQALWNIVWPKKWSDPGMSQLISIGIVNIIRVIGTYFFTQNQRVVGYNMMSGKSEIMFPLFRTAALCHFTLSVVNQYGNYCASNLGLIFKQKLTDTILTKYFVGGNYYHIESEIENVDTIITEDVEKISSTYSAYYSQLIDGGVRGLFFGIAQFVEQINQFGFIRGIPLAILPFVHVLIARKLVEKIVPADWSLFGKMSKKKGDFRTAQTRMVVHAEAISALRGGEREKHILQSVYEKVLEVQQKVYDTLVPHFTGNKAAMGYGLHLTIVMGTCAPVIYNTSVSGTSTEALALKRGNLNYQFMLMFQVLAASWSVITQLMEIGKVKEEGNRVWGLIRALDTLTAKQKTEKQEHFKEGDSIAFDDVDVYTPTGNLLVKNLSFEVDGQNDSLLLTGHNGAGKSSIFRCLAGLWKIPKGTITKPKPKEGNAATSLAGDVYYLPQKPYNVIGTLLDQLTYPKHATEADGLSRDRVREILSTVELDYLVDREGAFEEEINWEDALSLGEKQRLAIARLVHHRPRFAILDECTSGVPTNMEKRLYRLLNEMNISYITISHRPMLEAMHCKSLSLLGGEEKNYSYKILRTKSELRNLLEMDIRNERMTPKKPKKKGVVDNEETTLKDAEENRSKDYEYILKAKESRMTAFEKMSKLSSMWTDLKCVLKGGYPSNFNRLFYSIIVGAFTQSVLIGVRNIYLLTHMIGAMMQGDKAMFWRSFWYHIAHLIVNSWVDYYMLKWHCELQGALYQSVTKKMMNKYVSKVGYYGLKTLDGRITDPETRITDDVDTFATSVTQLQNDLFVPVLKILVFGANVAVNFGQTGSLQFGYIFCSALLFMGIMPDYRKIQKDKSKLVGEYKFSQSYVRTHCESIAFFGGGEQEKEIAMRRFNRGLEVEKEKSFKDWWYGWSKEIFGHRGTGMVTMYVQYLLSRDHTGDLIELSAKHSNIIGVNGVVKEQLMTVINNVDKFSTLAGTIQRLAEFDRVMDDIPLPPYMQKGFSRSNNAIVGNKKPTLSLKDVDIVTPGGICLARKLNVVVDPNNRLQITGRNAAGKTSFVRVVSGLWPSYKDGSIGGEVSIQGSVFVVPQKPYSVRGTLLDQVTYPDKFEEKDVDDDLLQKAQELLELVGIGYLVERDGGWHVDREFENVLSLGEQQRLGMARLFYRKPDFAILDECTDAVSVDVERRLYEAAVELGITCITVSKRLALEEFHEQEVRLGDPTYAAHEVKSIQKKLNGNYTNFF